MYTYIYIYIYIYIYVQGTHKMPAHKMQPTSAHKLQPDFPHIIPHIMFDGGLDIEPGKAEAETGVNRGETKVKVN